jgi:hypothetical protein
MQQKEWADTEMDPNPRIPMEKLAVRRKEERKRIKIKST